MASIEQAISALFDPSQPQHIKKSAMDLTESAKQDPLFYKFAMQKVLEINLDVPNSISYLFWYLQALEELLNRLYPSFPTDSHLEIQSFLFMIVDSRLDILQKHYGVLNKFALLYVRVLQTDFPENWPTGFSILLERVHRGGDFVKLFLTILKVFSEEFVEELGYLTQSQLKRSNILKDAIRQSVLTPASEIWKKILESGDPALVPLTLSVMVPYITWIPLEISLNFYRDFVNFLNSQATQIPALQCIDSLVNKKMDPTKKYKIIQDLNLVRFIEGFNFENFDMLSDVPKTVACLIDSLGENLLDVEPSPELGIVLECSLKCLNNTDPVVSRMVFGMIGKFIRGLKLRENSKPPKSISEQEYALITKIRMILMNRAQIPEDFDHVGPENSDEEDQFYKYRNELIDIFKNTLDLPGSKESFIEEITNFLQKLAPNTTPEQVELPYYLLFHFAEKVSEIGVLLKTKNKYSEIVEYMLKFEVPVHRIVLKIYFENVVRYSGFFEVPENLAVFKFPLQKFLQHLNSEDFVLKKHTIYMLYRLAIKNCFCLVANVESVLQAITNCLSKESDSENLAYLYKTIGLVIGNKSIDATMQFHLFTNLCDFILRNFNDNSIFIFTEIMSGFNRRVSPEIGEKIKIVTEFILKKTLDGPCSLESIKSICLLLQKLIDTLEEQSALYIKASLEFLIEIVNMDTIETFLQVISNCCHKISKNLQDFIPVQKLQNLFSQIARNIEMPSETISDIAQQSITVRRCIIKSFDILLIYFPEVFDYAEFNFLINYVAGMCCNFIESSTPKLALGFMGKLLEKIAIRNPLHELSQFIIATCYQINLEILTKKKIPAITPEVVQTAAELVNLHRNMMEYAKKIGQEEAFFQSLMQFMAGNHLENYLNCLKAVSSADGKNNEKVITMKNIIISLIEINKNSS